jgi:uncharacterized protein YqjF (DUF2071 family)
MIDRLSPRSSPSGWPVLHQRWSRLVFLHWPVAPSAVRALVPATLDLDLFEGAAWATLVAFTVSRMRPSLLPPVPGLSDAHQVNVRTYVHRDGVPGLWFLSLDANNPLAVCAARIGYRLPFFHARTHIREDGGVVGFRCERTDANCPKATFEAAWELRDTLPGPSLGTLDFFLLERYVLYSGTNDRLLRTRIHHRPWPLRRPMFRHVASTMLEAQGLPRRTDAPLTHGQAAPFDVVIWRPRHASVLRV